MAAIYLLAPQSTRHSAAVFRLPGIPYTRAVLIIEVRAAANGG
jgi:hypothetical protein